MKITRLTCNSGSDLNALPSVWGLASLAERSGQRFREGCVPEYFAACGDQSTRDYATHAVSKHSSRLHDVIASARI